MNKILAVTIALLTLVALSFTAPVPADAGWNPRAKEKATDQNVGDNEVARAIAALKNKNPGVNLFFEKAYGYAVFPSVGKGAIGIGGAHGKGKVYEEGDYIGNASLTQLTIGFQLGGQVYSEIIFFKDRDALDDFTAGRFKLGAQFSAIAATAGTSANAGYSGGVAIFTVAKNGLMYEASVGGQKFRFSPAE
ncbi:hypothetical protein MNBD_DELTA01-785 [hydrothermal vent metagenome]|uniref:Ysc84 actin-binding domain-containing protein n=1 Tax=hydrothermal vent metagenome TaxID=652676 RepID=A0A3B0QVM7_9ZZZZ